MFYCENCGREFEQPMTIYPAEPRGLKLMVCPFCQSMDVCHSIGKCDECGRFIYPSIESYYKLRTMLNTVFCDDCIERID